MVYIKLLKPGMRPCLSTYWNLLENGFRRGIIDNTLFIKKDKGDILLVQVYVDDIIFGSTKKSLCVEFESLMHKKFQMSSMGELTFFIGLQTTNTPIETDKALLKDEEAAGVDVHLYKSMIGSLMYLIASRHDIMFVVCACSRFQVTLKVSHLHAVKRIFRYLKGQPKLGLWYPKDSTFDLEAFSDSDYARASIDRKSTIGDSYEKRLIQVIKIHTDHNVADLLTKAFDVSREANYVNMQSRMDGRTYNIKQKCVKIQIPKRGQDTKIPQSGGPPEKVGDKTIHKEFGDRMERAATTASSLEAEQDSGMLRNLDPTSKKFLMYPRFLQLFLNNQIDLAEPFNDVYVTPVHTKKVFTNMKRQNKDFLGRVTLLFASMLVPQVVEGKGSGQPSEPQPPSSTAPPSHEEQVTTVASQP
ncbi:putative ribonuclease H-like domain-containing protein [Tanacetum coccineum]